MPLRRVGLIAADLEITVVIAFPLLALFRFVSVVLAAFLGTIGCPAPARQALELFVGERNAHFGGKRGQLLAGLASPGLF